MNRSKIVWADHTWNPITGCQSQCERCRYKSIINGLTYGDHRLNLSQTDFYHDDGDLKILDDQFVSETGAESKYPFGHMPTYHRYRLDRIGILKTGKNIVCGTIGEMFGYSSQADCYQEIFDACKANPQHNYMFLSAAGYGGLWVDDIIPRQDNMWYGSVVYNAREPIFTAKGYHCFAYMNPTEDLVHSLVARNVQTEWIVIGTGGCKYRKRKLPPREWIDNILEYADLYLIPVYMEDCFADMYPDGLRKEYPSQLRWEAGKRLSGRLKNKLMTSCGKCGKENLKADMVAIQGRVKRHIPAKLMGYICRGCFDSFCSEFDFKNLFGGNDDG